MIKIKVKKVRNVECYDFNSNTDIPFGENIEVEKTSFIDKKLMDGILEEVKINNKQDDKAQDGEGDVNDTGKSGKGKEKGEA